MTKAEDALIANLEAFTGFLNHQPEGCAQPHRFAAVKRKVDLFETCGFIACDAKQTDAALTDERHRLKGGKEHLFDAVLNGMDLHRPPCSTFLPHTTQASTLF